MRDGALPALACRGDVHMGRLDGANYEVEVPARALDLGSCE